MRKLRSDLWHWTARHPDWTPDQDWDPDVSSYVYEAPDALVLFDPLSPDWVDLDRRVERLGPPNVALSVYWHARSAQGILDRYEGTRVFAHESARDEAAERVTFTDEFRAGDSLPGGVDVLETGMTGETIFFVPAAGALVAGDVLLGTADGGIRVCPDSWLDGRATPEGLRGALRGILELPIELVLLTHGQPVVDDARGALERALAS
jgi:glyoxylase-like metal-dependent hydrolase (beta-lactamase superfamily II)